MNRALALGLGLLFAMPVMVNCADAASNYRQHCAKCHGEDGRGKTKAGQRLGARDYTDPKVQASVTDEAIAKSIKQGYTDKKTGRQIMKPTQGLTDAEVKELVAYMRKFKKD